MSETVKKVFEKPILTVMASALEPGDIIHDAGHRNLVGVVRAVDPRRSAESDEIRVRCEGDQHTRRIDWDAWVQVTRK